MTFCVTQGLVEGSEGYFAMGVVGREKLLGESKFEYKVSVEGGRVRESKRKEFEVRGRVCEMQKCRGRRSGYCMGEGKCVGGDSEGMR